MGPLTFWRINGKGFPEDVDTMAPGDLISLWGFLCYLLFLSCLFFMDTH